MSAVRVAAVGDVHLDQSRAGRLRPGLAGLAERADVLLLAGDLTNYGTVEETEVVVEEFADAGVPVVAVLGNHDYQTDNEERVRKILESAGWTVLEGEAAVLDVAGVRLGVAGAKAFGLGLAGRRGSNFGEPEMKAFARHGEESAARVAAALKTLAGRADVIVALTHYSPVGDTLVGEPAEIWPFLGNHLLADAVDAAGAHLAVHGHAHLGTERGVTPGGVPVRNVAQPVIRRPYALYALTAQDRGTVHDLPTAS